MDPNHIDAPEADYLYIDTSQLPNSGQGLFSAIAIEKDEIIAVFLGEMLSRKQAESRAAANNDKYFVSMVDGSIMDSMKTDCFAKYANDAEGFQSSTFRNNCKIALDENDNVCLIATRAIKSGAEIFVSYGKKYWANQLK